VRSRSTSSIFIVIIIVLVGAIVFLNRGFVRSTLQDWRKEDVPEAVSLDEIRGDDAGGIQENAETQHAASDLTEDDVVEDVETTEQIIETTPITNIPEEINLDVPFTSQAPHANWGLPYQEACEEAAILMAHHYFSGTTIANKEQADEELLEIVDFEEEYFGYYEHTTIVETAEMMRVMWDYTQEQLVLSKDVAVDAIKQELSQGNLVIVPTYGRGLGNPNYTEPGPGYHYLVIKGYTNTHFITNDSGTRLGADYVYTYDTLINAVHNWHNDGVELGERVMLIVRQ